MMPLYKMIATWFGCGLISPGPGTWGSLGAIPFGVLIYWLGGLYALIPAIFIITLIGYWAAHKFEKATNTHDSSMIVVDEVAGQWIALLAAGLNPVLIAAAFILFRFFDITKIWPANWIDEKVPGAAGVMGDDIIAGFYALLCVIGLRYAGLS